VEVSLLGLALGAAVGLILALSGAGGGVLAVPLLVFGMHLTVAQAAPVGLLAVGASSGLGAALGLREGIVRYRAAALIGSIGMALAPVGVYLAGRIPNAPLLVAFSIVLAIVSVRMFRRAAAGGSADSRPAPEQLPCVIDPVQGRLSWTLPCIRAMSGVGAVSGLLSGLLGVGGGFVIVPALTRFTDLPMRSILATSLAVIALISIAAIAAAAAHGSIDWTAAWPFAAGAIFALLAGRYVAARVAGARLQQAFAAVSAAVSLMMLARGLGWIAS
jgi:uncharacterized membrane protein YfcA